MMNPSYKSGFAPRDGIPRYPSLWKGCVGAWCPGLGPSGDVLRDWSGRKNHGTLTNMTLSDAWQPGSLAFDGTNDYVRIPHSNQMNFSTDIDFTFSFFVKYTGDITAILLDKRDSAGNGWFFIYYVGDLWFQLTGTGGTMLGTGLGVLDSGWSHLALVVKRTSVATLFVNGKFRANTGSVASVGNADNSKDMTVSSQLTSNALAGQQQLDDLRIYNRALPQTEISLLARRRRIAYELAPRAFAPQSATGNRRRRYLIGCS